MKLFGKSIPDRSNSRCRDSVIGAHVARVRTNGKEFNVAGAERSWTSLAMVRILYGVLVVLDTIGE